MKSKEVKRLLGVTQKTINNYIKAGKLNPVKMNSTHYEYDENEVYKLLGKEKERVSVTYGRVSLPKQKEDLQRQNERLYDFALKNGYKLSEQLSDIKSGMFFKERKSFVKLLDKVTNYQIDKVIIENKDRLVRFGYELLEALFKKFGTEIIVMSETDNKSYEQELTDDLLSIIHYYSMKHYSRQRALNNAAKALKETKETE